jgi:hypothetical protein
VQDEQLHLGACLAICEVCMLACQSLIAYQSLLASSDGEVGPSIGKGIAGQAIELAQEKAQSRLDNN